MATEEWQVTMVRDALRLARDSGEGATKASLREEVGMGSNDLDGALEQLRRSGELEEEAPGQYKLAADEDVPEGDEPELEVDEADLPAPPPPPSVADAAAVEPEVPGRRRDRPRVDMGELLKGLSPAGPGSPDVVLPRAVVNLLDDATLGAMVSAGVESKGEDEPFVLQVQP